MMFDEVFSFLPENVFNNFMSKIKNRMLSGNNGKGVLISARDLVMVTYIVENNDCKRVKHCQVQDKPEYIALEEKFSKRRGVTSSTAEFNLTRNLLKSLSLAECVELARRRGIISNQLCMDSFKKSFKECFNSNWPSGLVESRLNSFFDTTVMPGLRDSNIIKYIDFDKDVLISRGYVRTHIVLSGGLRTLSWKVSGCKSCEKLNNVIFYDFDEYLLSDEIKHYKEMFKYLGKGAMFDKLFRGACKSKCNSVIRAFFKRDSIVDKSVDALMTNEAMQEKIEESRKYFDSLIHNIPANPIDAYPLARRFKRHFVIHVGPTNSGKTHDAMQVLAKAASGVYLGPLRLLAYEKYLELNDMGCACSLVTGEERVIVDEAEHVSSTVEMADFDTYYDVAVIDEAQMLEDVARGSSWSAAILGIAAREVHVCCAKYALSVVKSLINLCGDTFDVVEHERLVPLEVDLSVGGYSFDTHVEKGDALIVFSRKAVHSVAYALTQIGYKVSIIYGALPHDVRQYEAQRFANGETDVVVATDAIGMGMNLPIKRIVFLETEKYDGLVYRDLTANEIQQIAGRAGRYGKFDVGYYRGVNKRESIKLQNKFEKEVKPISNLYLKPPVSLINVNNMLFSEALVCWSRLDTPKLFVRMRIDMFVYLARRVEVKVPVEVALTREFKEIEQKLVFMPFDIKNDYLLFTWVSLVQHALGKCSELPKIPSGGLSDNFGVLEAEYKLCDLLYYYGVAFDDTYDVDALMKRRGAISKHMCDLLASGARHETRTCRVCGKALPWNYQYGMCEKYELP